MTQHFFRWWAWYNNIDINSITCDSVYLTYHHAYKLTKHGTMFEQAEVGSTTKHLQPPTDIYTWRYRINSIRFSKYTMTPSQVTHTNKLTQPATTYTVANTLLREFLATAIRDASVLQKILRSSCKREGADDMHGLQCSTVLCFPTMVHMPPKMVIALGLG